MDISVIIVNYNVKYFLEQCLHSVARSSHHLQVEVFVVDNYSADGSVQMVSEKFPGVKLIANKENAGFAAANNQAARLATGKYILLLNPDTVIQEDTLTRCFGFMEANPLAGCLGVRMIDGKGRFLPESKRSLPTPWIAFYKIFGLSALFPRSRVFGQYHLGYLAADAVHEVDVISGAFMMLRREALDKTGLLDERFFMYGEDIDLSYRMQLAGYSNFYFPLTTIIHYKGESTRKGSINYVIVFYNAMILFARKHFSVQTARYYTFFIHLAIYIRAGISIIQRTLLNVANPLLDAAFIYTGYRIFLPVWESFHFGNAGSYPPLYLNAVVPAYIVIWIGSLFLSTGYEKTVKMSDMARGIAMGTLVILVVYALMPENYRFSRALILIGSAWAFAGTLSVRFLLSRIMKNDFRILAVRQKKRILIAGTLAESNRVLSIIRQTEVVPELAGFVSPMPGECPPGFVGTIEQVADLVKMNQVDELIFCANDIPSRVIIKIMLQFNDSRLEFKIAPPESLSVIGSSSNNTAGELYVLHFNTLSRLLNRRKKRLLDMLVALFLIPLSPLILIWVHRPEGLFRNIFRVLLGMGSWVGYYKTTGGDHPGLPQIKPGVLSPFDRLKSAADPIQAEKVNLLYARDYRIGHDLQIILSGWRQLGRNPGN